MRNRLFLFFILGMLLGTLSCKEEKKQEGEKPVVQLPEDRLKVQLKTLDDSSKAAWNSMIAEDDQKIAYVKRLLEEISYTKQYDAISQAKLMEQCLALKAKRFDESTFLVSANIDKYDAATDSLWRAVSALVIATPNVENYPLCAELVNDITTLDNNVVVRRIAYDKWASEYNRMLSEQKVTLEKLGPPYSELQKKGMFQLEQ